MMKIVKIYQKIDLTAPEQLAEWGDFSWLFFFTAVSNLLSITLKQQEPNLIDGVVSWFNQSHNIFS